MMFETVLAETPLRRAISRMFAMNEREV